jgi:predicted nuclease of predicted toxin-antitoxin system
VRFLVDNTLPPALARWLQDKGFKADHVYERGLGTADDRTVAIAAQEQGSILISKDADFIA